MTESRRAKFRKGLSSLYLPSYDGLCDLLGEPWQPFQGLRTIEQQDVLFAQGRSKPGKIVTWSQGGKSPHNYGCASDWIIFENGLPLWGMDEKDPRWREYQNAIEKVGGKWGSDWNMNGLTSDEKKIDLPHNELPIQCSWAHVYQAYRKNGMRAAQEFIEERLSKPEKAPTI